MSRARFRLSAPLLGAIVLTAFACKDEGGNRASDGTAGSADEATGVTDADETADDSLTDDAPLPDIGLPPSTCQSACEAREMCLGESSTSCNNTCDADHATHASTSAECVADFDALLMCIAALTCEDLEIYAEPPATGEYPCSVEDDTFTTSCLLGGEPPPATCEAYCAVLTMCEDISANECSAGCTMQLEFAHSLSEECGAAQTMLLDCIGTLDCPGYDAYLAGEPGYPCMAEDEASQVACEM